ncbi:phosphatase PAP2 family protein [Janthinobacterium sp. J1-1]|uniref:phosphatase PAP2 family protein n=1 Tax=unclassified Janthinobacterium TaxID=2610881 RepID=UPI0035B1493F
MSLLKRRSRSHCPWDIDQFGGTVPYYRLLEFMPDFVIAGNCFPAGHASGGLWLISLCVFWLPAEPKKAILAGVAGLAVGLTMGISQQLRGAHFLSHTLWSIWFAAALILALYFGSA